MSSEYGPQRRRVPQTRPISRPLDDDDMRLAGLASYGPELAPPKPKLALSSLVNSTLATMSEREQQRAKLINVLTLGQFLLTAAITIGYIGSGSPIFFALLASLAVYLVALVMGTVLRQASRASYVLVLGGAAAVIAQVVVAALSGTPTETAHSALLFVALIVEAGLLLEPNLTLIVATATTTLTASVLLITLNGQDAPAMRESYLIVVYALTLQALTGVLAWLLSQFIAESVTEGQRVQELAISHARLGALENQEEQRHRELERDLGQIQTAIAQALTGNYSARATVPGGELNVVARSLNLLLETLESGGQTPGPRVRGISGPLALDDLRGAFADRTPPGGVPASPQMSVDDIIQQVQTTNTLRMAKLQEQVRQVVASISHTQDGLSNASTDVNTAQLQVGKLVAATEGIVAAMQQQLALLGEARRLLGTVLPAEITGTGDVQRYVGDLALEGLGVGVERGLTNEFPILRESEFRGGETVPLPVFDLPAPAEGDQPRGEAPKKAEGRGRKKNELPGELVESWNTLKQLLEEYVQTERAAHAVLTDLMHLSTSARSVESGITWVTVALDAVRKNAATLQESAGIRIPPPEAADPIAGPVPPQQYPPRTAQPSRPLHPDEKLPELPDGAAELPPGSLRAQDLFSPQPLDTPDAPPPPAGGSDAGGLPPGV